MNEKPSHNGGGNAPSAKWMRTQVMGCQMSANLIGAFLCTFYFIVLDPPSLRPDLSFYVWAASIMTAGLVFIGFTLSYRWQKGIGLAASQLEEGRAMDETLLAKAQKRVLLAPAFYAFVSMFNWLLAAIIMGTVRYAAPMFGETAEGSLLEALRVFLGATISGLATASIVLFYMDRIFRKVRPAFFPSGGMLSVEGVFRLKLRSRLLFAFAMTSVVPIVIVAVSVYQKAAGLTGQNPETVFQGLLFTLVFVLASVMCVVTLLAHLVSASVADPVKEMESAMARVQEGDLDVQVPIRNNDELGSLGHSFNQMTEGLKERDRVKETFGRFVSADIASAILRDQPELGGEMTEVTVLFSDIRNYTGICEQLSPTSVIELLNAYFAYMVEAVEMHGGLVYQFVGDGIMAVFGAPVKRGDHAERAVNSAAEMIKALGDFNQKHRAGLAPLSIGVGINSGPVVAGIIGATQRMEYRVVGDAVNLAARVESLNKQYNTKVLLSGQTQKRLTGSHPLRRLGEAKVKGKTEPIEVYELITG